MGTSLDHALLCVTCFALNMLCDMCDELCEHYTWYIVYGTLGLENITLGVRKNKLNMIVRELN